MPDNDFLLFIDANRYLELYRTNSGKNLLAPLGEQVNYIFVTQQVFNEVQRNKIQVAANHFNDKLKELKLQTFGLPDHFSSTNIDQPKDIQQQMSKIVAQIKKINADVEALGLGIIEQISRSEDEVSKALSPIFAKAVPHCPEELQRARDRKELGNPPGKNNGSLGDQLNWEQILTRFKGKKRLWVISKDSDYGTVYNGKGFLNRFLYEELCNIAASKPEVYFFQDMAEGLTHFINTTGVTAENRLTPEEVEEIKKEEKSLPSLSIQSEGLRRLVELIEPNAGLFRLAGLIEPNEEVRRLANFIKADEGLRRLAGIIEPNAGLRQLRAMYLQNLTSMQSLGKDQDDKNEHPTLPLPEKNDYEEQEGDEGKGS